MKPQNLKISLAVATLALCFSVSSNSQDIKIAHIYSKTGPLEAYGKQTQTGLRHRRNHDGQRT
jgi:branched-chain amino acid transport system substrate-binding protein